MVRIAIIGNIGSGKTFISNLFGYPVFNADKVVSRIYLENRNIYLKLKKKLPGIFSNFPIKKKELINAILIDKKNIKKISSIVHPVVRKNLKEFVKKNKKKKAVILDIPLYLENKLKQKNDIIIFIQSNEKKVLQKIKKRKNYNSIIYDRLKKHQFPNKFKRNKSHYIVNNNFNKSSASKKIKDILKIINL